MSYEFLDHTGDVAARIRAATLDVLFADAALALAATLVDPRAVRPAQRIDLALEAGSPDLLLVDWLNELVYRFEVHGLIVASVHARVAGRGDAWRLDAVVAGDRFDAARHAVRVPVKGVTYHQLGIAPAGDGIETMVVFDI